MVSLPSGLPFIPALTPTSRSGLGCFAPSALCEWGIATVVGKGEAKNIVSQVSSLNRDRHGFDLSGSLDYAVACAPTTLLDDRGIHLGLGFVFVFGVAVGVAFDLVRLIFQAVGMFCFDLFCLFCMFCMFCMFCFVPWFAIKLLKECGLDDGKTNFAMRLLRVCHALPFVWYRFASQFSSFLSSLAYDLAICSAPSCSIESCVYE